MRRNCGIAAEFVLDCENPFNID